MRERFCVTESEIREGTNGICLACGEITYGGVEPDAREYPCESCGRDSVCGLEEALLLGLLRIVEE